MARGCYIFLFFRLLLISSGIWGSLERLTHFLPMFPFDSPWKHQKPFVFRCFRGGGCKMGILARNGSMTNHSHVFRSVQFSSTSRLLQQVWPSLKNITSTNTLCWKDLFGFPLAANIVESEDYEIVWKHLRDQIISIHYYQYIKFRFIVSRHNGLPHKTFLSWLCHFYVWNSNKVMNNLQGNILDVFHQ